jgi:hypothetical protein
MGSYDGENEPNIKLILAATAIEELWVCIVLFYIVAVPIGTEKSIRLRATINTPKEALPPEYIEFMDVFSEE